MNSRPQNDAAVTVRLMGGMGNQMFQFAAAYSIAKRTDSRLLLDTAFFKDSSVGQVTSRSYMLDLFRLDRGGISIARRDRGSLPVGRWTNEMWRVAKAKLLPGAYVRERGHGYDCTLATLSSPVYLDGYWQSYRYFEGIAQNVREVFTLRGDIPPNVAARCTEFQADPLAVALSVRRGDYVSNPRAARMHGVMDMDYYMAAMAWVRAQVGPVRIMIFSDDIAWAEQAFAGVRDAWVVSQELFGPRFEYKFLLMTHCRHHILANSTYAWWAAWLRLRDNGWVVAPRRWFAESTHSREDLIPPAWKSI